MQDGENKNILNMPRDTDLDFFAYGILKPGQIAYSKIKDYVDEKTKTMIDYPMKHRDGVPILLNQEKKHYRTNGYLLHFNDNKKAYEIISKSFSRKLYLWGTIDIENKKVNVLFGKNPEKGSNHIEGKDRRDFDGKNDPMFREAIELIEKNLKTEHFNGETGFYKLQMNYMLLWSAIDRYCKLKYNQKNEHDNRMRLCEEEIFQKALEEYAKNSHHRTIYTTDDLIKRTFNTEDPKYCINYYYTLRCNIVHRGKTSYDDIYMLEEATNELLNIFKYILKDTFDEEK